MKIYGNLDDGNPHLGSGTDFPANPLVGAIFEKTGDAHGPYYWNGTVWKLILTDTVASELGYTPVNKAGDTMTDSLSLPKASGKGLKVEGTYGWRDLIGTTPPRTGTNAPVLRVFRDNIDAYSYAASDVGDQAYHLPHDYAPGTDIFIHVHWGHNGTNIADSFIVKFYTTYSKNHSAAAFHAQKQATLTLNSLSITNSPQYVHRTDEIQFSTDGGSSSQLDTSLLEVDGLIMLKYEIDTIPTITGSAVSNTPYIFSIDIHYQSTSVGTKNKSSDFYA